MKKYIIAASIIAIIIATFLPIQPPIEREEGTTMVFIDPLTIPFSSNFSINVSCAPSRPVKGFEFRLSFNSTLLQANSVTEGDFFEGYATFFSPGIINNSEGTIINIYNLIVGKGNITHNGTLVTINFTAKDKIGASEINLHNVGLTNESTYIPVAVYNGSINIEEAYVMMLTIPGT